MCFLLFVCVILLVVGLVLQGGKHAIRFVLIPGKLNLFVLLALSLQLCFPSCCLAAVISGLFLLLVFCLLQSLVNFG
uniref:Uncharacterized protein n=1 Tax=Rhizophora mucronata TaxID=61149 RepID=A0A2P2NZP1_RHIMU